MSHSNKLIKPDEVVRRGDGRIDLFSTILARKDPEAQIPVLKDTISAHGGSSSSQPLPVTGEASLHQQRQYPASAPHTSSSVPSTTDPRKRRPSNSLLSEDDEAVGGHVAKAVKQDGTGVRAGSPKPWARGGRHGFETVFIGYCSKPSSVPPELAYWHDEHHLILKDMYPKAKVHMLILPRQSINKITGLSGPDGVKIVEQLVERANWLLERLKEETPMLEFRMGFHIIPSILQLHLHLISQDFCSDALKKKNHWNSFTTPFFITPDQVISTIKTKGTFAQTPKDLALYEAMLKRELMCNQCKEKPKNMPALKKHLEEHFVRKTKAHTRTM